jgi:hypothetical protein
MRTSVRNSSFSTAGRLSLITEISSGGLTDGVPVRVSSYAVLIESLFR